MPWEPFDSGSTMGKPGSEDGLVIVEEEYESGARICLEGQCKASEFAITCGLYGYMVHTRFFDTEHEARSAYADMKSDLAAMVKMIPASDESHSDDLVDRVIDRIEIFVERFPQGERHDTE